MKNVLYLGNALSQKGRALTSIETLSVRLEEFCSVKIASNKSNKVLRLLDMIWLVFSNRSKADYILIDTYSTINFYYAFIVSQLCRLFKIKYIPILHGGNLEKRLKNNPKLSSLIFKYAYKLVSPSIFLKKVFERYGYTNIQHIPNSIEIEDFEFQNRNIQTIKLLWVRSFASIYNPELAISVLEVLVQNGYEAELTMIGPDIDGLMAKIKNQVEEKNLNVNFTGKLSREAWRELSRHCNVFINTTNFDNMPVSVIEAMALGLPVVSTNVGGLPYLVIDDVDGLLVPPEDIDAMFNAIVKLKIHKNLKDKMVINARNKVELFDWKAIKPKWEMLLS
ncbi:glycosyltransferase family 4 protein [Winogradskyella luteola]|uniref:Glycosyltransferase family 4 protein n=1 Tax=Winogradskyella luteola TaxID=2828330 RepID=A0A9X1F8V4_9FLAO|nr:glycosyltransferase family 4 protein [Winogradskyella luteola]MBV7268563.1 glycosyltransferase family 4 protein [Winogradskyella luteola]